jgi:hypothetical protein
VDSLRPVPGSITGVLDTVAASESGRVTMSDFDAELRSMLDEMAHEHEARRTAA